LTKKIVKDYYVVEKRIYIVDFAIVEALRTTPLQWQNISLISDKGAYSLAANQKRLSNY
jgi:hypothetical protein